MELHDAEQNRTQTTVEILNPDLFNSELYLYKTLIKYNIINMKKTILVLGDIHGRTCWKDIIENESPDLTIFLGDYVSSHENISGNDQIYNLLDILDYKESNPDKVILLRGNHDMQHLGYYWAECSGFNRTVYEWMSQSSIKSRFLYNTQWMYIDGKYIFSHAGISKEWLSYYNISFENINNVGPDVCFGFTSSKMSDYYGDSPTQPLTWIRPWALEECAIEGFDQIVGHTRPSFSDREPPTIKTNTNNNIYMCDMLPHWYITITIDDQNEYKLNYKKYE